MMTKNIVIGVTGGIAAYKVCDFFGQMKKIASQNDYSVNFDVVMTEAATKFITPLTLQTLSKNKVAIDMFEQVDIMKPEHISLANKADVIVIMPATANTIGKLYNGIADNLLTTVVMAATSPIILCPAMNNNMWNNKYNQRNIYELSNDPQYTIINPIEGNLACNINAIGKMEKVETIVKIVNYTLLEQIKEISDRG